LAQDLQLSVVTTIRLHIQVEFLCETSVLSEDTYSHDERKERMLELLKKLHKEESGQDLIEYALIAALIAVGSVAAMGTLANKIGNEFGKVGNSLT
jgi:pilus assembly protein Flp/PilA